MNQADLPAARKLQEQVLVASRLILGPDHPKTLSVMINLAGTLAQQGDLSGARKLEEQALASLCGNLGPNHPLTLTAMSNLAMTLFLQGELPSAHTLLEQTLNARRRILGPRHPDVTTSEWNLLLITKQLDDDEARADLVERLRWLLDTDETALSSDQRKVRDSLRTSGLAAVPRPPHR